MCNCVAFSTIQISHTVTLTFINISMEIIKRKKYKWNKSYLHRLLVWTSSTYAYAQIICVDCWDKVTYVAESKAEINPFFRRQ